MPDMSLINSYQGALALLALVVVMGVFIAMLCLYRRQKKQLQALAHQQEKAAREALRQSDFLQVSEMTAQRITQDQAVALMAYLKVLGKLPFLDDEIIAGMRADYAAKRDRGAPVLPAISAWTDENYNAAKQAIIDEYCNVDMRLYADFFDSISEGTIALKSEEPIFAQQLYRELTAVVQRMITREGADVVKALRKAEESFQEYLDDEYNDY